MKPKKAIARYQALTDVFADSKKIQDQRKAKRLYWKEKDLD